jgi:uncharacterized protein (TIGR00156 family)
MKRRMMTGALALLLALGCSATAFAQQTRAFSNPITTVEEAKAGRDEQWVELSGTISAQLSREYFTFEDASGSITVEIDDDDLAHFLYRKGLNSLVNQKVSISGEIDREYSRGNTQLIIEVEYLEQLNE